MRQLDESRVVRPVVLVLCGLLGAGRGAFSGDLDGLEAVFDDVKRLAEDSSPVVCLIVTQHPDEIRQKMKTLDGLLKITQLKDRIEELSGLPCVVLHYIQLTRHDLNRPNVKAIVLTAWKKLTNEERKNELVALIKETTIPMIGFCGGHHFIYMAYGGKAGTMRSLRPSEVDLYPAYAPGLYKEWGNVTVRITKRDPIFDGLGEKIIVPERHYAECKELPTEFENLASSDECKIQAIKHKDKPLYGTQFHPEIYDSEHQDGKVVLENFFRIAGTRASLLEGIEGVYDDVRKLTQDSSPTVCVVDTQHPDTIREKMKERTGYWYIPKLRRIVEELSGLRCVAVHYTQIRKDDLSKPNIKALMITARSKQISKKHDEELFALIRETTIPTIGFCGGCQLIAQAYGGKVGLMRDLKPGEEDPNPKYTPGKYKEWGFQPVRIVKSDSLFEGMTDTIVVNEMHAWEIKALPNQFETLCSTDECRIEAIKHQGKILYGTQFHTEHYDDGHADGKTILRNFFKIAGTRADSSR